MSVVVFEAQSQKVFFSHDTREKNCQESVNNSPPSKRTSKQERVVSIEQVPSLTYGGIAFLFSSCFNIFSSHCYFFFILKNGFSLFCFLALFYFLSLPSCCCCALDA
jgi:hypothetical protein